MNQVDLWGKLLVLEEKNAIRVYDYKSHHTHCHFFSNLQRTINTLDTFWFWTPNIQDMVPYLQTILKADKKGDGVFICQSF